jgi:hypothetical protein
MMYQSFSRGSVSKFSPIIFSSFKPNGFIKIFRFSTLSDSYIQKNAPLYELFDSKDYKSVSAITASLRTYDGELHSKCISELIKIKSEFNDITKDVDDTLKDRSSSTLWLSGFTLAILFTSPTAAMISTFGAGVSICWKISINSDLRRYKRKLDDLELQSTQLVEIIELNEKYKK